MSKLTIVSSPVNEDIINVEACQTNTNLPFTRHKIIMKTLSAIYSDATFVTQEIEFEEIEHCVRESGLISKSYLEFLKFAHESYMMSDKNPELLSNYDQGLIANYFCKGSQCSNEKKLPYYLRCGIYTSDRDTSIFDYTYDAVLTSAYNSFIASNLIEHNSVIYCCNIIPGHHATEAQYNGYCFLNNAAICSSLLIEKYNKIAMLDLDFHHGDGAQEIFKSENKVLTISIHGDPSSSYPFYTGYIDENDEVNGNYNFPIKKDTSINDYLKVLDSALDIIIKYNPNVLVIPFGADTCINDPQGSFQLTVEDYAVIGKHIKSRLTIPTIVTQEGGYNLDVVGNVVCNFLDGLLV